jgi:hypothetical protein
MEDLMHVSVSGDSVVVLSSQVSTCSYGLSTCYRQVSHRGAQAQFADKHLNAE